MNMDPNATWWHSEDNNSPNLSKASLGRFVYHALKEGIEIGNLWAFNKNYERSLVLVTIKATKEQKESLEAKTNLKFKLPPTVHFN